MRYPGKMASMVASLLLFGISGTALAARTKVDRGINLFSKQDDIEMGKEAAAEVEKSLELIDDPVLNDYVTGIGKRVAAVSIEPAYPYRFKIVNSSEINAFALPGGYIYLNRGIIERAETEAEVAGVLAHEVGHVAARHGTNQLTKQVMLQVPLALVTGVAIKDDRGWKAGLARLGIQLGATGLFMSYSRKAETQSDVLAAQSLFDAGYDPLAMATFFGKLRAEQGKSPGAVERFFSSHPVPENREQRVVEEVALLGPARTGKREDHQEFARMKARLATVPVPEPGPPGRGAREPDRSSRRPAVPPPASRWTRFESPDGRVRGSMPANWSGRAERGGGFSLGPESGFDARSGVLSHGARVFFSRSRVGSSRAELVTGLEAAMDSLLRGASGARERRRARTLIELSGVRAARTILDGRARDAHGDYEQVIGVIVRPLESDPEYGSVVIYLIAPREGEDAWGDAFDRFLGGLRFR